MAARTHTYILYLSSGAQARRMLTYSMVPFCVLIMLPEKKRNPGEPSRLCSVRLACVLFKQLRVPAIWLYTSKQVGSDP